MQMAAIYTRVSSERQREAHTIASQTAALVEWATTLDLEVPRDWIFEDDGYSGATLARPGLERVRDLAAAGDIEVVLVHSPDRLSRKYAYQVLLIEELGRHGVETRFLNAPSSATAEDQLLVQFQGMIAEYERAQILERSRRGKLAAPRCRARSRASRRRHRLASEDNWARPAAGAARQHRAGQVPHPDRRQQEEAAVVDHTLQIPRPSRIVPADPAVPRRHAPRRTGELQTANHRPLRPRRENQIAQLGDEGDRVPEVVVAPHQLPEQQALGGLAHQLEASGSMSRTLPTSGRPGSPAAVRGTRVTEPGARPRRLSGSTSVPSASSRSRNSRHSRAFSPPFGRRHRNSSHTVRASSIRLKPEQSCMTSRTRVPSRALSKPVPRTSSSPRAGAVTTSRGCPKRDGWRRWPDAVPGQSAPKSEHRGITRITPYE